LYTRFANTACYHFRAFDLWANTENHDRGSPLRRRPREHERPGSALRAKYPLEIIATDTPAAIVRPGGRIAGPTSVEFGQCAVAGCRVICKFLLLVCPLVQLQQQLRTHESQ
jgi:hypothetical protein